jgi:hypothetical protein
MVDDVVAKLDDLETGRWYERNRDILDKPELDLGTARLC